MMKWECQISDCENCNIKTKRICNSGAHKIWKFDKMISAFKTDIAATRKQESLWMSLIDTLKGASKVMKEVEEHKHPEYKLKAVDPALRKLLTKLTRGDYD